MTGPLDESRPFDNDAAPPPEALPDDEESADAWRFLRAWRRDLEQRRVPVEGPEAWRHVEELLDLALAERAQRAVDRIIARRRAEQ